MSKEHHNFSWCLRLKSCTDSTSCHYLGAKKRNSQRECQTLKFPTAMPGSGTAEIPRSISSAQPHFPSVGHGVSATAFFCFFTGKILRGHRYLFLGCRLRIKLSMQCLSFQERTTELQQSSTLTQSAQEKLDQDVQTSTLCCLQSKLLLQKLCSGSDAARVKGSRLSGACCVPGLYTAVLEQ